MAVLQVSDFWSSTSVLHPVAVGTIVLSVIWIYLRIASARHLNNLSVFSIVGNITLGSTMSRIITQPDLDLTRGILALSTIICFEATAGWLVMHGPLFAKIFQKQPVLLAFRGDIYDKQLMRYSVHIRKVYQALRGAGCNDPAQAECIILEPNGIITVIRRLVNEFEDPAPALDDVPGYTERRAEYEKLHKNQAGTRSLPANLKPIEAVLEAIARMDAPERRRVQSTATSIATDATATAEKGVGQGIRGSPV